MSIAAPRTPAEHEQARAFDAGYATAQEEIDRLTADNAKLRALVKELADDLEAELEGHYSCTKDHPAYEVDISIVHKARATLANE